MHLIEFFVSHLREQIPGLDFSYNGDEFLVRISPVDDDFGTIEIEDDLDELIVIAGNFTHWHAGCYEEGLSENQKYLKISESVVDFIKDTIEDKIVFWGTLKNGGGFYYPESEKYEWEGEKRSWSGIYEN